MTRNLNDVETRLDDGGNLRPMSFNYDGQRIQVVSHGRQWEANGARHYLVMDQHHRVYELAHYQVDNMWELIRSPESFGPQRWQAV